MIWLAVAYLGQHVRAEGGEIVMGRRQESSTVASDGAVVSRGARQASPSLLTGLCLPSGVVAGLVAVPSWAATCT